jgi:hypothetical protein
MCAVGDSGEKIKKTTHAGSMCITMNKTGNLSVYVEDCLV